MLSVILCLLSYPEIRCGVPFKCRPNCHNRNGKRCFYCACPQDTALRSTRSAASPELTDEAFNCFVFLVIFYFIFPFLSTSCVMAGSFFLSLLSQMGSLFVFLFEGMLVVLISGHKNLILGYSAVFFPPCFFSTLKSKIQMPRQVAEGSNICPFMSNVPNTKDDFFLVCLFATDVKQFFCGK